MIGPLVLAIIAWVSSCNPTDGVVLRAANTSEIAGAGLYQFRETGDQTRTIVMMIISWNTH